MQTCSEYRRRARVALEENLFSTSWLLLLLATVVASAIIGALGFSFIGPVLVMGPLMVGLAVFTLHTVRGTAEKNDLNPLFDGFRKDFTGGLLLGLMYCIFIFLWSLLLIIPGIIKFYSYAMCFYIKADHPEYDYRACLAESERMMRGHKWQLFCLELSFIGWAIIGSLCFGVGILWVDAYQTAAVAAFYEDLRAQEADATAGATV